MAYFLGLLITDGYINDERGYIGIDLTDKDVIQFLSEYINIPYKEILPRGEAVLTKYRITIYGRNYVSDCERLGVVYHKTYNSIGPRLREDEINYLSYIFRGIVDGDGWISKDGREFFVCSASVNFIKWCENIMINLGFQNIKITHINNEYNGIYLIRTASKYNIETLKNKVYNKPFGMMRKYNRLWQKDVQRL